MKKAALTILLISAMAVLAKAQDYKTGIGLRAGPAYGFTIKHFISEKGALEGLMTSKWHGFDLTGLYEVHDLAFNTENLRWYYGGGAHFGFYKGDTKEWGIPGSSSGVFGIDGIIGIEYKFDEVPINLGLDLKPAIDLIGFSGFWAEFGVSVRYVF